VQVVRRFLPAVLLVLLLALPSSAAAATRWVVKGAGFGHGIGMSQYGAYGMARDGSSYKQILAHYYRGTTVARAANQTIRVLLESGADRASFTGATRANARKLKSTETYYARVQGAGIELRDRRGKALGTFAAPLDIGGPKGLVRVGGTAINGVDDGTYRGGLELRPSDGGGVTVVNALSLDDYVKGVVPGEMPSLWSTEALKAQAVAARTYAITSHAGGGVFDQYADTRSQVYRGVNAETPSTNAAVDETAGEIVEYQGQPAVTYFFSTSGGHTENVENVFYGSDPKPYLRGVPDPADKISPNHRWQLGYTQNGLESKLRDYLKGRLRAVTIIKHGVSPRIVAADVVGSRGKVRVTGTQLRQALGAMDNWMTFTRVRVDPTRATAPRSLGLAGLVFGGGRGVVGNVEPANGRAKVYAYRLEHGTWKRARSGHTSRAGAFRLALTDPGTYRIKIAGIDAGTVQVR
jgi:stage II sporulation protein D